MKSVYTPGQAMEHVSLGELAKLAEAGGSTRGSLLAILRHLAELCPRCGEDLAPLFERLQATSSEARNEQGFLAQLLKTAWELSAERGEENWQALAEEMLSLPAEDRDALWHCDPRTHQLALGMALLELGESRLAAHTAETNRAAEAKQAAELVLALVERRATDLPPGHPGLESLAADQAAQAFALLAQVALLGKNTEAAAGPLLAARATADQGTGDPEVAAAVGITEALLLWVRGDGEASLRAHEQVARLWAAVGEPVREALVQARRATVLDSLGRPAEALAARARSASLCRLAGVDPPTCGWLEEEPSGTRH